MNRRADNLEIAVGGKHTLKVPMQTNVSRLPEVALTLSQVFECFVLDVDRP
jgi:hypothetical protein